MATKTDPVKQDGAAEYSGLTASYYEVQIDHPHKGVPYLAECLDIIEALKMNYVEGETFKSLWRSCAARALGKRKLGYKDGVYDAEKISFFAQRILTNALRNQNKIDAVTPTLNNSTAEPDESDSH